MVRKRIATIMLLVSLLLPLGVQAQPQQYYRTQLSEMAAQFYDALRDQLEQMRLQPGEIELTDYFADNGSLADTEYLIQELTAACRALEYDDPTLFWLDFSQLRMHTSRIVQGETVLRYRVWIAPGEQGTYFAPGFDAQQVEQKVAQTKEAAQRIADEAAQQPQPYDKIRTAHDLLVRQTHYDQGQGSGAHSAYAALVERSAVCDGYAGAFQLILDCLGIPCISISGEVNADGERQPHMWNAVQLEGSWYGVDVTWDDPVVPDGEWDVLRHTYFLLGEEAMARSHTPVLVFWEGGDTFTLPALQPQNYGAGQLWTLWAALWDWIASLLTWIGA